MLKSYLYIQIKPFTFTGVMKTSESRYSKCMYFSTNALARKIEKQAVESLKPVNLSPSHGYLLMAGLEEAGIQPGVLADEMQLRPSTITRLLERLEEKKLVIRTTEGKLTNVYPTPKAKELMGKLKDCLQHFYSSYSSILGKEECAKMISNINKLADKLED